MQNLAIIYDVLHNIRCLLTRTYQYLELLISSISVENYIKKLLIFQFILYGSFNQRVTRLCTFISIPKFEFMARLQILDGRMHDNSQNDIRLNNLCKKQDNNMTLCASRSIE